MPFYSQMALPTSAGFHLNESPAMSQPSTSGGIFSGLGDFLQSGLQVYAQTQAVRAQSKATANSSQPPALDAFGRLPGQPGYGTATAPGVTSGGMSPLKIGAMVAGALLLVVIALKAIKS